MTVDTSNLGKFYIAGQWVAPRSQANMPVLNPANERQIGIVPLGDAADVDAAVAAAVSAFPAYSQTRKSERVALLQSLMKVTQSRFEDLAQAMRMEMGAPITMAREAQADAAIGHLQGFMDALARVGGTGDFEQWGHSFTRADWGVRINHPLELADEPNCLEGHPGLGDGLLLRFETL
jgi:acyl-CoA reductase-like NAD-dependent aldehyde dehydrogenase